MRSESKIIIAISLIGIIALLGYIRSQDLSVVTKASCNIENMSIEASDIFTINDVFWSNSKETCLGIFETNKSKSRRLSLIDLNVHNFAASIVVNNMEEEAFYSYIEQYK